MSRLFLLMVLLAAAGTRAAPAAQDWLQLEQAARRFLQTQRGQDGYDYQLQPTPRAWTPPACPQAPQVSWPGEQAPQPALLLGCASLGWSLRLPLTAQALPTVLVTTRLLRAGDIIQPADIRLAVVGNKGQAAQGLRDSQQVLGRSVRGTVPAGAMLLAAQLREPYVVKMNQPVKLLVQGEGFTVAGDGVALANASAGERVNVRTAAGKVVSALVAADGSVSLSLP